MSAVQTASYAQPAPQPNNRAPNDSPDEATPRVERSKLETFYMEDKDGNLVGLFDIPFEDFDEIYARYKGYESAEKRRRYALHSIKVEGSAAGDTAALKIKVTVTTKVTGWVRVPLRFSNVVLRGVDPSNDSTDRFLEYEEDGDGYIWWIRGTADKRFVLQVTAAKRLRIAGGKYWLSFNVTPAPSQELRLRVPHAVGRVIEPALSENAELGNSRTVSNKETELSVLWNGASVELGWRDVENKGDGKSPTLEVGGNIFARFTGQDEVRCVAELDVAAIAGSIQSFDVRLPPGMVLQKDGDPPGYTVTEVNPQPKDAAAKGRLVRVRLAQAAKTAPQITLAASKSLRRGGATSLHEIAGFEVVGAPLQSGFFHLAIDDDWSLKVVEGANVRREENVTEDLRFEDVKVIARFAYDAQPCSLQVRPVRRRKSLNIQPQYLFLVDDTRVTLHASLTCRLRGPNTNHISMDLTGWTVDQIGERNLIDTDKTILDAVSPLDIYFSSSAPKTGGPFELTIRASRPLNEPTLKDDKLTLAMPATDATSFSAASVVVSSASNVILRPIGAELSGLVEDTAPPSVEFPDDLPTDLRPAIFFREMPNLNSRVFVSEFEKRNQEISVTTTALATVLAGKIEMRLQHTYEVAYAPLGVLLIDVPRSLLDRDRKFSLALDQKPLEPKEPESDTEVSEGWTRLRVTLDRARQGRFVVVASFEQPIGAEVTSDPTTIEIPLSVPASASTLAARLDHLEVTADDRLLVAPDAAEWTTVDSKDSLPPKTYTPKVQKNSTSVKLAISENQVFDDLRTVVEVAWIQTWLTGKRRQERAVFRLTTQESLLQVQLPQGAQLDGMLIDGEQLSRVAVSDSGEVSVALSVVATPSQRVIEARYSFPNRRADVDNRRYGLPQLVEASWTRRCFWQLIVPSDEHLLHVPGNLTPELAWKWRDFYWARQANRDQRSLERLSGAQQEPSLPQATNQYLFSSFGEIPDVQINTAPRLHIMMGVSLVTMVALLLVICNPRLRHPAALLMIALLLMFAAALYPHTVLAVAQIAILSVVGVIVAVLLRWAFERPREGRAVIRGASRSASENATTETYATPSDYGSNASTHLGQVAIHLAEPSTHSAESHAQ